MSALDSTTTILASGVRLTVPLAFAACGEYVAERAGTMNKIGRASCRERV